MPKYYPFKIADHYLYFTAECIVEAMHVYASDRKLTEAHSAKKGQHMALRIQSTYRRRSRKQSGSSCRYDCCE